MTFVDSILEIFGPLLKGLPIVILPKKVTQNVESFVEALHSMKITRLFAITSLIRNILTFLEMKQKKVICHHNGNEGSNAIKEHVALHRVKFSISIIFQFNYEVDTIRDFEFYDQISTTQYIMLDTR